LAAETGVIAREEVMPMPDLALRRRLNVLLRLLALTLFVTALASPAGAQANRGTVEAVVVDNTNLPLPGVTVRVTRPETGSDTTGVTSASGLVRIPALRPGKYDVAFDLQGSNQLVEKGVTLRVGQTLVINATLQAKLTETVTVTAEAPVVDVHKLDSSTNIVPEQAAGRVLWQREGVRQTGFVIPSFTLTWRTGSRRSWSGTRSNWTSAGSSGQGSPPSRRSCWPAASSSTEARPGY
jgi:hypothetical protein